MDQKVNIFDKCLFLDKDYGTNSTEIIEVRSQLYFKHTQRWRKATFPWEIFFFEEVMSFLANFSHKLIRGAQWYRIATVRTSEQGHVALWLSFQWMKISVKILWLTIDECLFKIYFI